MRITAAGTAERRPRRSRLEHPDRLADSFRRGELTAGLAAVAVAGQLALAPVTLLVAGLLVITGRISRWRLTWLLLPALGGTCWLIVAGFAPVAHAVATGAGRLLAAELAVAVDPKRLLHPVAAFAGSGRWLKSGLPLLVLAGTSEAVVVLWLGGAPAAGWRRGPVAAARCRAATVALAGGRTVTADGCAIGVDDRSGRLATVSWAEAERGILLAGAAPAGPGQAGPGQLGLAITCAALRRRKAVVVLDLAGRATGMAPEVALHARRVGVPLTEIGLLGQVSPAAQQRPAGLRGTVSLAGATGRAIRSRSAVVMSARRSAVGQSAVGQSAVGRFAVGQSAVGQSAVAQSAAAQSEAEHLAAAQHAVTDLVNALTSLRELGLRGDCLAWITGCEAADVSRLRELLALGPATGTAVVLSASSPDLVADLARVTGLVIACGPIADNLALRLADACVRDDASAPAAKSVGAKHVFADILVRQHRNSATVIARGTVSGRASFRIVPVAIAEVR